MASLYLGRRILLQGGTCSWWRRSEMADPECMGDKQEHPLVPLRLRGTGGTCAGPAGAEPAPALSSKAPGHI